MEVPKLLRIPKKNQTRRSYHHPTIPISFTATNQISEGFGIMKNGFIWHRWLVLVAPLFDPRCFAAPWLAPPSAWPNGWKVPIQWNDRRPRFRLTPAPNVYRLFTLDVSKNRGKTPKMDGGNNGKPYFLMDDLGVPLFLETPIWIIHLYTSCKKDRGWKTNPFLLGFG